MGKNQRYFGTRHVGIKYQRYRSTAQRAGEVSPGSRTDSHVPQVCLFSQGRTMEVGTVSFSYMFLQCTILNDSIHTVAHANISHHPHQRE